MAVALVFRDISSVAFNFSFCSELRRCRESPTWIFLLCFFTRSKIGQTWIFLYFSTNWHIWRRLRPLFKFPKFATISNFFFFREFFFYLNFDKICAKITLQISFIRFCSFGRSKLLQAWIFWYFSTNWHIQQRLRPFFNFQNFEFFLVFLLEFFFLNMKSPDFLVFLHELAYLEKFEANFEYFKVFTSFCLEIFLVFNFLFICFDCYPKPS